MKDMLNALAPLVESLPDRAREIEAARRLPADIAQEMARAGVFRLFIPQDIGGLEADLLDGWAVIEHLAEAEASVGWCAMIASTSAYKAGFMPRETAREIYGDPLGIYGGVFAPMGTAVAEGEGYRIDGRWQWASGSANCTWLSGGCRLLEDGEPRLLANGQPDSRMAIFPADRAELLDTWHVAGLNGTGSGDMRVNDLYVPATHTVSLQADAPAVDGPLYQFPTFGLLSQGIAAVALGNARAALRETVRLAQARRPGGGRRRQSERGAAQAALARAEAALASARSYARDTLATAWQAAAAGEGLSDAHRLALRLSATHAVRTAAEVTREAYDLGGGAALFLDSPLQRRQRDALAMTQHMMVAPASYELTGRLLMGEATDTTFL